MLYLLTLLLLAVFCLQVLQLARPTRSASRSVEVAEPASAPSPSPAPRLKPGLHRASKRDTWNSIDEHDLRFLELEALHITSPPSHGPPKRD